MDMGRSFISLPLFSSINNAAWLFGSLFIFEGILLLYELIFKNSVKYFMPSVPKDIIAYIFIVFGLIIYPIIHLMLGHSFSGIIIIGITLSNNNFYFWVLYACS
jgi:hypothetical protein